MKLLLLLLFFFSLSFYSSAQMKPLQDKRMYGNFIESDSIYRGDKNFPKELILKEDTLIKEKVIHYLKKIDVDYVRFLALGEANNHKYFAIIYQGTNNKLFFISKNFKHSRNCIFSQKRHAKLSAKDDEFTLIIDHKKVRRTLKYKRAIPESSQ